MIRVLSLQLFVAPSRSLALGSFFLVLDREVISLRSRDRFSMKFVIGRRFDSLLSLTSCGSFF
jgi:hypothetical protein